MAHPAPSPVPSSATSSSSPCYITHSHRQQHPPQKQHTPSHHRHGFPSPISPLGYTPPSSVSSSSINMGPQESTLATPASTSPALPKIVSPTTPSSFSLPSSVSSTSRTLQSSRDRSRSPPSPTSQRSTTSSSNMLVLNGGSHSNFSATASALPPATLSTTAVAVSSLSRGARSRTPASTSTSTPPPSPLLQASSATVPAMPQQPQQQQQRPSYSHYGGQNDQDHDRQDHPQHHQHHSPHDQAMRGSSKVPGMAPPSEVSTAAAAAAAASYTSQELAIAYSMVTSTRQQQQQQQRREAQEQKPVQECPPGQPDKESRPSPPAPASDALSSLWKKSTPLQEPYFQTRHTIASQHTLSTLGGVLFSLDEEPTEFNQDMYIAMRNRIFELEAKTVNYAPFNRSRKRSMDRSAISGSSPEYYDNEVEYGHHAKRPAYQYSSHPSYPSWYAPETYHSGSHPHRNQYHYQHQPDRQDRPSRTAERGWEQRSSQSQGNAYFEQEPRPISPPSNNQAPSPPRPQAPPPIQPRHPPAQQFQPIHPKPPQGQTPIAPQPSQQQQSITSAEAQQQQQQQQQRQSFKQQQHRQQQQAQSDYSRTYHLQKHMRMIDQQRAAQMAQQQQRQQQQQQQQEPFKPIQRHYQPHQRMYPHHQQHAQSLPIAIQPHPQQQQPSGSAQVNQGPVQSLVQQQQRATTLQQQHQLAHQQLIQRYQQQQRQLQQQHNKPPTRQFQYLRERPAVLKNTPTKAAAAAVAATTSTATASGMTASSSMGGPMDRMALPPVKKSVRPLECSNCMALDYTLMWKPSSPTSLGADSDPSATAAIYCPTCIQYYQAHGRSRPQPPFRINYLKKIHHRFKRELHEVRFQGWQDAQVLEIEDKMSEQEFQKVFHPTAEDEREGSQSGGGHGGGVHGQSRQHSLANSLRGTPAHSASASPAPGTRNGTPVALSPTLTRATAAAMARPLSKEADSVVVIKIEDSDDDMLPSAAGKSTTDDVPLKPEEVRTFQSESSVGDLFGHRWKTEPMVGYTLVHFGGSDRTRMVPMNPTVPSLTVSFNRSKETVTFAFRVLVNGLCLLSSGGGPPALHMPEMADDDESEEEKEDEEEEEERNEDEEGPEEAAGAGSGLVSGSERERTLGGVHAPVGIVNKAMDVDSA